MAKRSAASELNHDNWNQEEPPEKAGTFRKAAPDVLQTRVIKSAKRRSLGTPESARASNTPFANFCGFAKTSSLTNIKSEGSGSTNGSIPKLAPSSSKEDEKRTECAGDKSQDYFSKIKGLNESVSKWIKTHVDSNPFCILTPILKDYEKYLNEIEAEEAKRQASQEDPKTQSSGSGFKGFSFNKGNTTTKLGQSSPAKEEEKRTSEKPTGSLTNPFTSGKPLTFSFGTGATSPPETKSAGFTFGSEKPFTFANVSKPATETNEERKASDEETEEPPKAEFAPIVEEGAKYSKRCKVFVKKGSALQDRGIGTLYLKPVDSSNKTQLIVRAENSLGNLLINTLVSSSMSAQRKGSNVVMLVCIPTPESEPPPVPVMLRVKTSEDADQLLEKLQEYM